MEIETTHWKIVEQTIYRPASARPKNVCSPLVPVTFYTTVGKRAVDFFLSLAFIALVLSWLTPLLFLLIKLDSKGPLFFVQLRTGRNGKPFPCYKFRTMHVNNCSHTQQATGSDERITRIGHFLRTTHIDELPQLINVLLNQMSIVGPRPHMLYHDLLFADLLPHYVLRQLVKPGITGLAQSAGYYGATPDFLSVSGRTRLDLFYLKHVSPAMDLRIIFATLIMVPVKCFKRSAAYDR